MSSVEEFQARAREWLAHNFRRLAPGEPPPDDADPTAERVAAARAMQAQLFAAGFAGITFPVEVGGQALTLAHELAFLKEAERYDTPTQVFAVSVNIIARTLLKFGNDAQRKHVSAILRGEEIWLQLLSEPAAGSDLGGLRARADRDGDTYVVNGQKVWSTGAHYADFAICPVRTNWDVPKYAGISVLALDLRAPGVEIRRIRQIDGRADFCEEFLTDVRVSSDAVVGAVDDGWRVVRGLLEIEHEWVGRSGGRAPTPDSVDDLADLARRHGAAGRDFVRLGIAEVFVRQRVQRLAAERIARGIAAGELSPAIGGVLRMGRDQIFQLRAELGMSIAATAVLGGAADALDSQWGNSYLASRAYSIQGGTAEVQRNNVGEKVLGLPREVAVDRDLPFRQVTAMN